MKKALFLFFLLAALGAAGLDETSAQAPAAPPAEGAAAPEGTPQQPRKRRGRKLPPKKAPPAAAETAAKEEPAAAPKPANGHSGRAAETRRVNSLLYGAMERLETLAALHENLRLQVSEDTLKKISEIEKAANKVAADYFKVEEPSPEREALKTYRGLLDSALKGVKALKDMKDRVRPEESGAAIVLCKELNAAVDEELAGAKLSASAAAAAPEPAPVEEAAAPAEPAGGGDTALSALAEVKKALEAFKEKENKYPRHLSKLAPKYLSRLPELSVADHPATREALEIDSSDYDEAPYQAITDTGKWLYFADKKSKYYGRVLIDCSHKDAGGAELYKAGE